MNSDHYPTQRARLCLGFALTTLGLCSAPAFGRITGAPISSANSQAPDPSAPEDRALDPILELHTSAALEAAISKLEREHGDLVARIELGKSREGRAISALRLAAGEIEVGRPAILMVANLEGSDLFDSSLALHHATKLAEMYGDDERATALLDEVTLYIIPRANPDAAEARFATPLYERITGGHGRDTDRDGRNGEDGPADIDGDGLILWMRVPDSEGTWIADPTDARASKQADKTAGERGKWKIMPEGRDFDGDKEIAEDPPHDTRVNRNFPAGWIEHDAEYGLYPTDEPEVRALADFVLAHRDIALVLCTGAPDTLLAKRKTVADDARSVKRVPPDGTFKSDDALLKRIADDYKKALDGAPTGADHTPGTFQRWCYDERGLLVISTVLWEMPKGFDAPEEEDAPESGLTDVDSEEHHDEHSDARNTGALGYIDDEPQDLKPTGYLGADDESETDSDESASDERDESTDTDGEGEEEEDEPKPTDDAERLKWIDGSGEAWRFADWTSFEHPDLGTVEIGGFTPYARNEPPEHERAELATGHLEFLLGLGSKLAKVEVLECTAEDLGGELWRVKVVVHNNRMLPLLSQAAKRTRTIRAARLQLDAGNAQVLTGPKRVQIRNLDGDGGRSETTWMIRAKSLDGVRATLVSDHAGSDQSAVEVKQ